MKMARVALVFSSVLPVSSWKRSALNRALRGSALPIFEGPIAEDLKQFLRGPELIHVVEGVGPLACREGAHLLGSEGMKAVQVIAIIDAEPTIFRTGRRPV